MVGIVGEAARCIDVVRVVPHLRRIELLHPGHDDAVIVHEHRNARRVGDRALVDGAGVDRAALEDSHEAQPPVPVRRAQRGEQVRRHPLRRLRDERGVGDAERDLERVERRKPAPARLGVGGKALRRGRRRLVLCQTIDAVVEQHHHDVEVVPQRVYPVAGADRRAVAVAHDDEHGEVRAMQPDPRRNRQRATVNAVKSVGLEVMREPAGATDAGDEYRLFGDELLARQELLHRGEDRVIAAAGAPAGAGALVVAQRVFVLVVVLVQHGESAGNRHRAPPRGMRPRIAPRIEPGRSGSPGTRVQQSTSTSVEARSSMASCPRRRFSSVMCGSPSSSL